MAIAEKDWEWMKEVVAYFQGTKTLSCPQGSIRETATHFQMTRTKVTKVLVTAGEYRSSLTDKVQELRGEGLSVKEIAEKLGISTGTVSSYLPYTQEFHGTADPSKHTESVRQYRAYEKAQKERQKDLKKENPAEDWKAQWKREAAMSFKAGASRPVRATWENLEGLVGKQRADGYREEHKIIEEGEERSRRAYESLASLPELDEEQEEQKEAELHFSGLFPGALYSRNKKDLEAIWGEKLPFTPRNVMRIHLEIMGVDEEELATLRKYGGVKGDTITRDIVVPSDIPLYALHFVIQRSFGWQSGYTHDFILPRKQTLAFCENQISLWQKMVGIIYCSPFMPEKDRYWAENYKGGSLKNYFRSKYTGPYYSRCQAEGLYECQRDMQYIDPEDEIYVRVWDYTKKNGEVKSTYFFAGLVKDGKPKTKRDERIEIIRFKDFPLDQLENMFGDFAFNLLERLPISSVLWPGFNYLPGGKGGEEAQYIAENICSSATEELSLLSDSMEKALQKKEDSPYNQVLPWPFATEMYYLYCYHGTGWGVRITASDNCVDLIKNGTIDQLTLDKANIKCRETYRPVVIARDGDMMHGDFDGLDFYTRFLRGINPELEGRSPEEQERLLREKSEFLSFAESEGWQRYDASNPNLL